jgi:uncharacterized protein (TIGR03435 family)
MLRQVFLSVAAIGLAHAQTYEVASIRPNHSGEKATWGVLPGGTFRAVNEPLKVLMQFAYNVQDFQISGGPSWIGSAGYDVLAKLDVPLQPNVDTRDAFRELLRKLLEERFRLTVRRTEKELSVYSLTLNKGGSKMTEKEKPQPRDLRMSGGKGLMIGQNIPIAIVVESLAGVLGRPVKNETGLTGYYDFRLEWTPDDADPTGPSLFTAIQEQLGLRLETRKAPAEVLVIEHAEPVPEP